MIKFISYLALVFLVFSCNSESQQTNSINSEPELIFSTVTSHRTNKPILLSMKFSSRLTEYHYLNLEDLKILRNEIFARKGYIFTSTELFEYFSKYEWYKPRYSISEIDTYFSELDKENIKTIVLCENKIKLDIESFESFSFSDFLDSIPDLLLPLDFTDIKYVDPDAKRRFHSMDYQYKEKYHFLEGGPFGKVTINDTLTVIGLAAASDHQTYLNIIKVNKIGQTLEIISIPQFKRTYSNNNAFSGDNENRDIITEYNKVIITSDLFYTITNWEIKTIQDSLGNIEKQIFSDTLTGKTDLIEITN